MLRNRRRTAKFACPRWGEAGTELLRQLLSIHSRRCALATQLSRLLGAHTSSPQVLYAEAARQLTTAPHVDTKVAFNKTQSPDILDWAPSDSSLLGRAQHAVEDLRPRTMHMLVPL